MPDGIILTSPGVPHPQVADIGHMAAPFEQHKEWSMRLEDEFLRQGDLENELGFPISPLMDRSKPSVMHPSNQVAFSSIVVTPMLDAWLKTFPISGRQLHSQATANTLHWQTELSNSDSKHHP